MDRTYKKGIYNYCIKLWDKLKEEDGAYLPSKHDETVYNEASKHFNLSVEEINKIFSEVSRGIADKQFAGMTWEQRKEEAKKIVENNAETPWGKR
jgi:hypothetical protein